MPDLIPDCYSNKCDFCSPILKTSDFTALVPVLNDGDDAADLDTVASFAAIGNRLMSMDDTV